MCPDNDEINLFESGRLSLEGKNFIQPRLLHEVASTSFFKMLQDVFSEKINENNEMKNIGERDLIGGNLQHETVKTIISMTEDHLKDIRLIFEILELMNQNIIENRKWAKFIIEQIVKNKDVSEDSTRLIIEKQEQLEEKSKFSEKALDNLSNSIKEHLPTLKYVSRSLKEKSEDTEKNE